ncbi:unnamed protein product [Dicrocoelium dendriticum]|nr:unnamed protein product [Dicrocoelium dendriticum]
MSPRMFLDQLNLATSSLVHQFTLPTRKRYWNLKDVEEPLSFPKTSLQKSPKVAQLSPPTLLLIERKSSLASRNSCNGLFLALGCDASYALNVRYHLLYLPRKSFIARTPHCTSTKQLRPL